MDIVAVAFAMALGNVEIGQPVKFMNLTMVPLLGERQGEPAYMTLDEALQAGTARVTEVSDAGSVSELRFLNEGAKPVLLLDGEELVGAKQDRILNVTILAAAQKITSIPVSCVEAGRWDYRSPSFQAEDRLQYSQARAAKAEQVSESLRRSGTRRSDQGAIWDDLAAKASRLGTDSPTGAMANMYVRHEASIDGFVENLPAAEGQVGSIFAIDGTIVGLDMFDSPTTFAKLLPKLMRSYALDALDSRSPVTSPASRDEAARFLATVASAKTETFPAVGLGDDVRLSGREVVGGALVVDRTVIHLGAFLKTRMRDREPKDTGTRIIRSLDRQRFH